MGGVKTLVTGGAGYIGSVCVEQLLDAGHDVTVLDNLTEGHRSAVDPRAKFILGQPEKSWLGVSCLRERCDGANFDKAEAKAKHCIWYFCILVEARSQPDRGWKREASQRDRQCRILRLRCPARKPLQGCDREAVCSADGQLQIETFPAR